MALPATLATLATAAKIIRVGARAYAYFKDDAKNRFVLVQPYYARLVFSGPVWDALVSGLGFRTKYGGLEYLAENKSALLGIVNGYRWNGADLVPDHKHDIPEESAWGSEFLASLEHDFILEYRKQIAAQLNLSVRQVEDFAHSLFALREKQFGKPFRGKAFAYSMKPGYPVFATAKRWLSLSFIVAALCFSATGCKFAHVFDEELTPPMPKFKYIITESPYCDDLEIPEK